MHIALVTHYYAPEDGAPQRRWGAFVERFVAAGHRVSVLAPSPHYPSGRLQGTDATLLPGTVSLGEHQETVYRLPFREHGDGLVSRSADQATTAVHAWRRGLRTFRARDDRPDIVIATAPGIPSIAAGLGMTRAWHVPLVVEMRDAWPDLIAPSGMWASAGRHGWRAQARSTAHRVITRQQRDAAAVVTTTVAFADVMRDRGMRRVSVIRNGADVAHIAPLAPPPAISDRLRVLYLGTLGRSQGLGAAVRAARLVQDRGVGITLRIVGSGADWTYLQDEIRRLDAPVELVERVPPEDVLEHYRWCDTALVSLRDWEPFEWTVPSKLYEILAVGRHVSAALAGEAALVVEEAGAGSLVAPQSVPALADLWCDLAQDRSRLDVGGRGRSWVLRHADHDRLAARYLELLEDVLA